MALFRIILLGLICVSKEVFSQTQSWVSPCPRLFTYEKPGPERDRWYGIVTLLSDSDLSGVWLRLIFDKPSVQLGNWFGEVVTTDNIEYLIKNRNHRLKANTPFTIRFFLKYIEGEEPPKLLMFRLNAKTVCPEGLATTENPTTALQLQTSSVLSTTFNPISDNRPVEFPVFEQPSGVVPDEEVYPSDYGLIQNQNQNQNDNPIVDDVQCGTVVLRPRRFTRQAQSTFIYEQPNMYNGWAAWANAVVKYIENVEMTTQRNTRSTYSQYNPNYNVTQVQYSSSYSNQYSTTQNNYRPVRTTQRPSYSKTQYRKNSDSARQNTRKRNQKKPNNVQNQYGQNNNNFYSDDQVQPRPLITYGQSTREGEFPWHAALYHARGIDLGYICGASLISKFHVITVAHCVTRRKSKIPLNPDNLLVYLGKYYLREWSNKGIQNRQISNIIVHPNYDATAYRHDIALLKFIKSVEFSDYVRPICLWENGEDINSVLNQLGTVVGWGFDETGRPTEKLTQAKMPVVTKETCIYSFPSFFSRFTTEQTYCAGFRNGTSVCNGDSGGGMVFPKRGSTAAAPVWQLRGLVSISVALQNQFKCDTTNYVVFTDVAKYLPWIRQAMRSRNV